MSLGNSQLFLCMKKKRKKGKNLFKGKYEAARAL